MDKTKLKNKEQHILIIGFTCTLLLVGTLFILISNSQKALNAELTNNVNELKNQQKELFAAFTAAENIRNNEIEKINQSVIVTLIEYFTCVNKYSLEVKNGEVLDAVSAKCTPPFAGVPIQFEASNSVFLDCFIEKGLTIANNDSTEYITQECIELDNKISKKIAIEIQDSNN
jgi:DNA phosphorothioation-dependent restriction protein DptG